MSYEGPAVLLNRADRRELVRADAEFADDTSAPGRARSGTLTFRSEDPTSLVQPLGDFYVVRLGDDSDSPEVEAAVRHQDGANHEVIHLTGDTPLP